MYGNSSQDSSVRRVPVSSPCTPSPQKREFCSLNTSHKDDGFIFDASQCISHSVVSDLVDQSVTVSSSLSRAELPALDEISLMPGLFRRKGDMF